MRPEDYQQPILPKNLKRFTLLDVDPLEIARQLTLVEMNIFMKIQPIELMNQEWSKKNTVSAAVNVRAMTSMSTKITGWVICTVVQEADVKRRAAVLKHFVKVAEVWITYIALFSVEQF
jgi:son of sevenless-like protein